MTASPMWALVTSSPRVSSWRWIPLTSRSIRSAWMSRLRQGGRAGLARCLRGGGGPPAAAGFELALDTADQSLDPLGLDVALAAGEADGLGELHAVEGFAL